MTLEELLDYINNNPINRETFKKFSNKPVKQPDGSYKIEKGEYTLRSKVSLKPGDMLNVKHRIETTVGRMIFNKLLLIEIFGDHYEYVNHPVKINDMIEELTVDMINKKITSKQVGKFIDGVVWVSGVGNMIYPSPSEKILVPNKKAMALRKELTKKYAKEIEINPVSYIDLVEKPVMKALIDDVKDDPGFEWYMLGKPSKGNNLKQTIGVMSPIKDPITGEFMIPNTSLSEGMAPEDMDIYANSNIVGTASRALDTANGGAIVKAISGALYTIRADKAGTDCGTKRYRTVTLSPDIKDQFLYNYIVEKGGKLVKLTNDNYDEYKNKTVKMRSVLYCEHEDGNKVCSKCAGDLPYMVEMVHLGNLSTRVGFKFVKLSLKQFHDSTIKSNKINPFEYMSSAQKSKKK